MKIHEEWKWSKHHCIFSQTDFFSLEKRQKPFDLAPQFSASFTNMYEIVVKELCQNQITQL